MLKVNKKSEPEEFTKYKSKNKIINWDSFTAEIKQVLKQYLLEEQENSCCPYCEMEINLNDSQIEHIKPKDKFPKLLADHDNLVACCLESKRCGNSKANKWDELFINPVIENPEDYFEYDIKTGEITPIFKEGNRYEKAKYTIDLLNLNDNRLCNIRRKYILEFSNYTKYNKNSLGDYPIKFPSLRRYLEKSFL
ncbi:TIGR02646 family protein [Fusobacterium polymorphum]|jgi:TIGR02646 family protein|uniref:TIGR02646 family protein n=1 Tax=Fusobacterium nucleatum subsp. polymorphum TaxID=76857 RepID=A0A1Z3CIL6_FUSNP|nr:MULTISPECIES: retron system putative HNH endonuclease [Fusobacterium]ASC03467.1 TIGR02646 family protein [Fusobacterium polymorphum]MCG6838549.1 TIGR02646 family protein [Fusobacterium nucleatum]